MLAALTWLMGLTAPLFGIFGIEISWRDIILIGGGLTASAIRVKATLGGGLSLSDGVAGDQIILDNGLINPLSGVQRLVFADGTSIDQATLFKRATTGDGSAQQILYGATGHVRPLGLVRSYLLVQAVGGKGGMYGGFLQNEVELLECQPDTYVLHEHLELNHPLYFHEFAGRAAELVWTSDFAQADRNAIITLWQQKGPMLVMQSVAWEEKPEQAITSHLIWRLNLIRKIHCC